MQRASSLWPKADSTGLVENDDNRASGAYRVGFGWAGESSSVGRSLNASVPAARWMYLYPAIDQHGQVIDVLVSRKRDLAATRRFFTVVLEHGARPIRGDPPTGRRPTSRYR
jgi:hypothetical protein